MRTQRVLFFLVVVALAIVLILIFAVLASGTGAHLPSQPSAAASGAQLTQARRVGMVSPSGANAGLMRRVTRPHMTVAGEAA